MGDRQPEVNSDILQLYALSTSIGQSLDPTEACRTFVDSLMALKDLAYSAVWIHSSQQDDMVDDTGYTLFYAVPEIRAATRHLGEDNASFQFTSSRMYRTVRVGDPDFDKVIAEKGVEKGAYALFDLKDIGLLKLYSRHDNAFPPRELNLLSTVVDKFAIAVSGAFAHKRLLVESARRIAAQHSLERHTSLLRSLIDSVPDLIFYKDAKSVYLGCNKAFEAYANREESEITGHTDFDFFDRETAEFFRNKDMAMMAAGTQRRNEEWIEYPDGRQVLLDTLKTPYYGPDGQVHGLIGVSRDITDRKRAEEEISSLNAELETRVIRRTRELEEATAYNRMLFNTSPVGLLLSDMDGKLVDVNPAFLDIIGYTEEEAKELSCWDIIPKEYESQEIKMRASLKETGHYDSYEKEYLQKDGRRVPVRLSGLLVQRDGNSYIWSSVEDISKSKVTERALIEAKEAAETASQAKSAFLANMSHEIRTPMNAIIGMSHLALQSDLSPKHRNYIEKVHYSAENLLGIINDILDFSKIESGKLDMEVTDFRLEDVMENLANLVGLKAEEKGLELVFNISLEVPTALTGDPLRLGQILINLGNNAVKFTEQGGEILVTVKVEEEDEESVFLRFSVQDTGIGMTEEEQVKVFQSFSQADNSTTRRFGGTGLGLVISKKLAEMMQGDIWLESEYRYGSRFHFTVRLEKQQDQPMKGFTSTDYRALKVLVVDDNATSREILSDMLAGFGLGVDQAATGAAAIARLEQADKEIPYNLILMDWKMPAMDGIETARIIQNDLGLFYLPTVIMITAYNREAALQAARGVELASFLTKPVCPSTLLETILHAIGYEWVREGRPRHYRQDSSGAIQKLQGAKVLLVEDNEINRELALDLLVNNGLIVEFVNNGAEALEMLEKESFDGVLMDCQMPIMDGYTATRRIRGHKHLKDLPVIAMTANAMAGDREKVLAAGMNDHIAKPINVNEMFNTLAKWITPRKPLTAWEIPTVAPFSKVDDGLVELPGIDTVVGLAITQGNIRLYRKLLIRFRANHGDFEQQFYTAQADPDPDAATRAAHTLKGVAANIGAVGVQTAAQALETACEEHPESIEKPLATVLAELQAVLAGLKTLDDSSREDTTGPSPGIDKSTVESLLLELHARITQNNVNALDTLEKLEPLLSKTYCTKQFYRVVQEIEGYDFDTALDALAKLAKELDVPL